MPNKNITVLTTSFPIQSQPEAGWFIKNECVYLGNKFNVTVVCPFTNKTALTEKLPIKRFKYSFIKKESIAYGQGIAINLKQSLLAKIQLPFFFLSFFITSFFIVKRGDTIYCHWLPSLLIGVFIKKLKKNNLIYMNHHFHKKSFVYKWALRNVDVLLSNSKKNEEHTLKIFPINNHYINYIGVNKHLYKPSDTKEDRAIFQILCVGRFIELKGHFLLLQAINKIKNRHNIKLTLIGGGALKKEYTSYIKNNKLEKYISIVGPLKKEEVIPYYQSSDLFVLPTRSSKTLGQEGLGTVLIEASFCGLPIIASDSGGIKEVVEKCENGLIIAPNDEKKLTFAIESLLTNPNLLTKFKLNARKKAIANFDETILLKNLISCFEKHT